MIPQQKRKYVNTILKSVWDKIEQIDYLILILSLTMTSFWSTIIDALNPFDDDVGKSGM